MERLIIKELAVYLPYELKLYIWDGGYEKPIEYPTLIGLHGDSIIQSGYRFKSIHCGDEIFSRPEMSNSLSIIKPLLRPMSDLFKLIDWDNNGDPYMLGYKYGVEKVSEDGVEFYANEYSAGYCESPTCHVDITAINWWLFEHHFDVFGLIDRGLALPIDGKEVEG